MPMQLNELPKADAPDDDYGPVMPVATANIALRDGWISLGRLIEASHTLLGGIGGVFRLHRLLEDGTICLLGPGDEAAGGKKSLRT